MVIRATSSRVERRGGEEDEGGRRTLGEVPIAAGLAVHGWFGARDKGCEDGGCVGALEE